MRDSSSINMMTMMMMMMMMRMIMTTTMMMKITVMTTLMLIMIFTMMMVTTSMMMMTMMTTLMMVIMTMLELIPRSERLDSLMAGGCPLGWRPRGVLVAHLAEHTGSVTRVTAVPDTTLMASTSTDGSVKVWDCARMESGKNVANKARQTFSKNVPLDGLAATSHNHCLALAARDGTVAIYNIEKQSVVVSRRLELEEDGAPVDLTFCDLHSAPVLYYCTSFGAITGR